MTTATKKLLGQFIRLTDKEKYEFLKSISSSNAPIIAYTTSGKPLTVEEYIHEIQIAIDQVERGEVISSDDLKEEMKKW